MVAGSLSSARGELIQVQLALEKADLPEEERRRLKAREKKLLQQTEEACLGRELAALRVPKHRLLRAGIEYLIRGRGILTFSPANGTGFLRSKPELAEPDLQLAFSPASYSPLKPGQLKPAQRPHPTAGAPERRASKERTRRLPEQCHLPNAPLAGRLGCGQPYPVVGRGFENRDWAHETTQSDRARHRQWRAQPVDRSLDCGGGAR